MPVLLPSTLCTSGIGLCKLRCLCVGLRACMGMSAVSRHSIRSHAIRRRSMRTGRSISIAARLRGTRSRVIAVLELRRSRRTSESFVSNELAEADLDLGTAHIESLTLLLIGRTRGLAEIGLSEAPVGRGNLLVDDEHRALEHLLLRLTVVGLRGGRHRLVLLWRRRSLNLGNIRTGSTRTETRTWYRLRDMRLTRFCTAKRDGALVRALAGWMPVTTVARCTTVGARHAAPAAPASPSSTRWHT